MLAISTLTLQKLITSTPQNCIGLVTTELDDPSGFGRVVQDSNGQVISIIEEKDASIEQRAIKTIHSGIFLAPTLKLKEWLPKLTSNNVQGEYYLTDIIGAANTHGVSIVAIPATFKEEVLGINDRVQLAYLERYYQRQMATQIMLSGVTLLDPERFDLRGDLVADEDVIIDINVVLEGQIRLGKNCRIGPNCMLKNVQLGNNVEILANCVIEDAIIDADCKIGPFARIRPGTHLSMNARIGNFVELKNARIGSHTKINHLSYIGDAQVGRQVTIGAGTITCNYDGANKHKTIIEDDVFIGSDTQLVAPITIGQGATIGAGSTITRDAAPHELTLSRAKQTTLSGWKRPRKKDTE